MKEFLLMVPASFRIISNSIWVKFTDYLFFHNWSLNGSYKISRKDLVLTFLVFLFTNLELHAQKEVSVNNFTGTAIVQIPLIDIGINGLIHPVMLRYVAESVKVKQEPGEIGIGWSLEAGGSIERIVNGFPDELKPIGSNPNSGWTEQNNYRIPFDFQISDDNNEATCADEAINYNNILNVYPYVRDTEPDKLIVNAPGLNCTIIIDNNNNFKVIPAQDIKIQGVPTSFDPYFIITNAAGVKYVFRTTTRVTKTVYREYVNYDLFNKEYTQFKTPVTYAKTWHLDEIYAPDGKTSMIFNYLSTAPTTVVSESIVDSIAVNRTVESGSTYKLTSIRGSNNMSIDIKRTLNRITEFSIVDGNGAFSTIILNELRGTDRQILESITEVSGGCTEKLYSFKYNGYTLGDPYGTLPSWLDVTRFDAWGNLHNSPTKLPLFVYPGMAGLKDIYRPYRIPNYQGEVYSLGGDATLVDEEALKVGVMSKILYPTGGSSIFEYETNSFWDEDGNAEIKGAGVRIRKISHFDGISPEKSIINEYFYNVPGQSRTSGTILSLPQFALTTNYFHNPATSVTLSNQQILGLCSVQSAKYWDYHTLISKEDMSPENHDVHYEYVTVKGSLAGRTEYRYSIPTNLWTQDNNSMVYVAAKCDVAKEAGLPVKKSYAKYPFSYKEDFGYSSGLVLQVKMFSDSNKPVKVLDYEYEDYNPNQLIYGLAFDHVYGNLMFSRYAISVNSKVLKREKETIYDAGSGVAGQVFETLYDNSGPGRALRSKTMISSDQAVNQVYYTYSGDFALQPSDITVDPFLEGIYLLNLHNMKNTVVEQLVKIKQPQEQLFKTFKGELTLYKKNPLTNFPVSTINKTFNSIAGVENFNSVVPVAGPGGKSLVYNTGFRTKQQFDGFNDYNLPETITENRVKKTFKYQPGLSIPIAEFIGAESSSIAFNNDFLVENPSQFPASSIDGYTDRSARVLKSGVAFYKSFVKPVNSRFYTLSIWVKADQESTINVLMNNAVVTTISCNVVGKYVFYQKQIDVSVLPVNSVIKLQSAQTVNIDDIVFCPQEVNYILTSYRYPFGKASEITSAGKTMLYEYDTKGRPTYVKDGDRNILKFTRYQNYNTSSATLSAHFSPAEAPKANIPTVFTTENNCLSGVKYNWNFGDGTLLETYDLQVKHTFPIGGPYTVTLIASHPELGTQTYSSVYTLPLNITICVSGLVTKDLCGIASSVYGGCSEALYPPPYSGATLYVTSANGCLAANNYTYEWQILKNGSWKPAGISGTKLDQNLMVGVYTYRCLVKSQVCGTSGYSDSITLTYYKSKPNCPTENEN